VTVGSSSKHVQDVLDYSPFFLKRLPTSIGAAVPAAVMLNGRIVGWTSQPDLLYKQLRKDHQEVKKTLTP
jgi:hypothetical protein